MCRVVFRALARLTNAVTYIHVRVNMAQRVRFTCYQIPCPTYSPLISSYQYFSKHVQRETKHDETHTTHVFTNLPLNPINLHTLALPPQIQNPNTTDHRRQYRPRPLGSRIPSPANEVKTKPHCVFSLALYSQTFGAGKASEATWRDPKSSG